MNGADRTAASLSDFLQLAPLPTARDAALKIRQELDELLSTQIGKYTSEDTSLVVFGSLARGQWTSASYLDWTYLIDGQANSDHLVIAQKIQKILKDHKERFRPPGQTGTFGNMAFSHDIIHQIGGHNDTNRNTTERILLLLESVAIGRSNQAYERIIRGVINRYLEEDNHLLTRDSRRYRVPRFLLNDIVRFWRTMAVDFASKQRDRAGEGWGLRNAKLRMSRKLIFVSGLLTCFSCNLDQNLQTKISTGKRGTKVTRPLDLVHLENHIMQFVSKPPLDILAMAAIEYGFDNDVAEKLFSAYDEFLEMVADPKKREHLKHLRAEDSRNDQVFAQVQDFSSRFADALNRVFFANP